MEDPTRGSTRRLSPRQMEILWTAVFVAFLGGMGLWLGRQFGAF